MFAFTSLVNLSLLVLTGAFTASAAPASGPITSCIIPPPGNYSFQSVSLPGELVGLGQGFTLVLEKAPPMGNLGVWTLTQADQGGYTILNVEEGRNVTTEHLVESNLFIPLLAEQGNEGATYAVQCAGNGEFVIKAIDADQLWTIIPGTSVSDMEEGVGRIEMLPSDGSTAQRFILNAL